MRIPDKFYNEPLEDDKTKFLIELKESGILGKLYRHGIITPTISKSLEARLKIRDLMAQGSKKGDAVRYVANMMGLHPKYIYKYLE